MLLLDHFDLSVDFLGCWFTILGDKQCEEFRLLYQSRTRSYILVSSFMV